MEKLIGISRLFFAAAHIFAGALMVGGCFFWTNTDQQNRLKLWWASAMMSLLGVKLRKSGNVPKTYSGGALVVANHISFVDIFAISSVIPATFVSKSDVTSWPILGWMAAKAGTLFIERGSRRAAHRVQEQMVERLLDGHIVAIFPEGTTSNGKAVLPFHAALLQSAIDAKADVVCVSLSYLDRDGQPSERAAYVGDKTLLACLWQIVTSGGLQVRIRWTETLSAPHGDRRHLSSHAHRVIAHSLAESHENKEDR